MKAAPRWTRDQLSIEAAAARAIFRRERLDEPLVRWKEIFDHHRGKFAKLIDYFSATAPVTITPAQLVAIFKDELGDELRYLAGPPISADDLKVLAETTLAPAALEKDVEGAKRVIDTIFQAIDPRRFPWVAESRQPTEAERATAIVASAAMLAKQRVQTDRANEGKEQQEAAVKAFLIGMGHKQVPARPISNLTSAPNPGEFCGEALVGSRKADIALRLDDGRLLPIECKVSNSSTNSVKRLNNDAAVKAGIWLREFGTNQIVPAAVLSGVFKVHNLEQAQHGNLTLFWAHKLDDMRSFIEAAK
jgi:hypothetical protein